MIIWLIRSCDGPTHSIFKVSVLRYSTKHIKLGSTPQLVSVVTHASTCHQWPLTWMNALRPWAAPFVSLMWLTVCLSSRYSQAFLSATALCRWEMGPSVSSVMPSLLANGATHCRLQIHTHGQIFKEYTCLHVCTNTGVFTIKYTHRPVDTLTCLSWNWAYVLTPWRPPYGQWQTALH